MLLTLRQAAEQTGKTKQSIHQAIQNGKISATKNHKGEWEIQAVDLFNHYKPVNKTDDNSLTKTDGALQADLTLRVKELELENNFKDKDLARQEEQITDLKEDRDRWRGQAERLSLTHQPQPSSHSAHPVPSSSSHFNPIVPTGKPVSESVPLTPEAKPRWKPSATLREAFFVFLGIVALLVAVGVAFYVWEGRS